MGNLSRFMRQLRSIESRLAFDGTSRKRFFADEGAGDGGGGGGGGDEGAAAAAAKGGESWRDGLGDLKSHPAAEKFKTPTDLFKSYVELEKVIGQDKIVLPSKDAKPEQIAEFWKKLGAPDKAEGYKIPDTVKLPPELLKGFVEVALKNRLLPNQAAGMAAALQEIMANGQDQIGKENAVKSQATEAALRKELGRAYDERIALAKRVAQSDPGLVEYLNEKGDDPRLLRFIVNMSAKMAEGGLKGVGSGSYTLSPEEAQTEINKIMGNADHPYFKGQHPEHKAAMARMTELFEMVHANKG